MCLFATYFWYVQMFIYLLEKNTTAIFALKGVTIGCETRQVHLWQNTAALWTESGSLLGRKHRWSYWDPKSAGDLVHPFFFTWLWQKQRECADVRKSWGGEKLRLLIFYMNNLGDLASSYFVTRGRTIWRDMLISGIPRLLGKGYGWTSHASNRIEKSQFCSSLLLFLQLAEVLMVWMITSESEVAEVP